MRCIRDLGGRSGRSDLPRPVRRALKRMYRIPKQHVPFKSSAMPDIEPQHLSHPFGERRPIGVAAIVMRRLVAAGHVAVMGRLRLYGMTRQHVPIRYCITEAGAKYTEGHL